jgi:type I restriction enzyme M protein
MRGVKKIEEQVRKIFDSLRGKIGSQDYDIILLLLSLYKDDQISKDILLLKSEEQNHLRISEFLKSAMKSPDEYVGLSSIQLYYSEIIDSFENYSLSFFNFDLRECIEILFQIDSTILKEKFCEIFDSILYTIYQSQGKKSNGIVQPIELTRFICELADLPKNSRIFNPFAGPASFGVYFDNDQNYFGQEINQKTWAIGALRLMAHNRQINNISESIATDYLHQDSILSWPNQSEKFDLIVTHPPFNVKLGPEHFLFNPDIRTLEQFLIQRGVNSLNSKGKLIALLPNNFLFKSSNQDRILRKNLIKDDLIDSIISFPPGLLQNTGIPLIILVIDKDKQNPGKVRFIEANNFVDSIDSHNSILNDFEFINLIKGIQQDSDTVKFVDNSKIIEAKYNLNVSMYFQEDIEGVKLGDILDSFQGIRVNLPEKGKLVRIRDLKDDEIDYTLVLPDIEETELNSNHFREINASCILLANKWKTLKPTLFDFSKTSIFLNPNITSFKINEKIVDKAYLINELHADYVLKQLDVVRLGATIPYIRKADLLKIVLKLPSLEEQRAKMQGIVELSDKIKVLKQERNALAHGSVITQFNEYASLKHTLGRPRQNILDWTDNLLDFLNNSESFDALNNEFFEYYQLDIISALKEIKRDVNFMSEVLDKGENGFVVEEYDKTILTLSDVNKQINELSGNGFNFKIERDLLVGEKLKDRGIYGNKIPLKILIDNLLTNAHKYAFERNGIANEVIFELKEVDEFLLMEVRNNGKPFPKNFDRDKFITKFSTADSKSGTGLGGYDINQVAVEFNNPDWELILNSDPIYPVIFKFKFPIKIID